MGKSCLTIKNVIQRALALQMMIDRGWTEYNIANHSDEKNTKDFREFVLEWSSRYGIPCWLTEKEKSIWDKQTGGLTTQEAAFCTWRMEALVPLLWALGLKDAMPHYAEHAEDDHHKLLHFGQEYPLEKILKDIDGEEDGCLQKKASEIEAQAELYKLVRWRCSQYLYNHGKMNMHTEPVRVFGEDIRQTIAMLPLDEEGELLVKRSSLGFDQMSDNEVKILELIAENRLQALNWLLGQDVQWDGIATEEL